MQFGELTKSWLLGSGNLFAPMSYDAQFTWNLKSRPITPIWAVPEPEGSNVGTELISRPRIEAAIFTSN